MTAERRVSRPLDFTAANGGRWERGSARRLPRQDTSPDVSTCEEVVKSESSAGISRTLRPFTPPKGNELTIACVRRERVAPKERCVELAAIVLVVHVAAANRAAAQPPAGAAVTKPAPPAERPETDDDAVLNPAEPDYVVVNLPTGMRLPRFKANFRLTHRFAGNLKRGTFTQQASNLFGIDQGAIIGFEYRFAPVRHVQAAFYRSSFDKTIQLHGKYDAIRQHRFVPVSLSPIGSIEGTDNFQEQFAPAVGVTVSRTIGTVGAAYLTPIWVENSAASLRAIEHTHAGDSSSSPAEGVQPRRSTTLIGVGGRVRVHGTTYLAGEIVPRATGYAPDRLAFGVSLEKRVGAHVFSLTVTNTFGTTFAQVARGGAANTLYLGFNLARKFN